MTESAAVRQSTIRPAAAAIASPPEQASLRFTLAPADPTRLALLCGPADDSLRAMERALAVVIHNRGHAFTVAGEAPATEIARQALRTLYAEAARGALGLRDIHLHLHEAQQRVARRDAAGDDSAEADSVVAAAAASPVSAHAAHTASATDRTDGAREGGDAHNGRSVAPIVIAAGRGEIRARGANQRRYLHCIRSHDLTFAIGPAGSGKTWLAVAGAVEALQRETVRRLILVRPAVEAGERLGFLPGDLADKVDPYLRPLYDALYEMLGVDRVTRLIERRVIEIAPLAFMRGRTLNDAFVILDEAQNTTIEQMKMFLTRIGFGAVAVVAGDITQVDLPRTVPSGLRHALATLRGVKGVGAVAFDADDVVRHPLVRRIVRAYERAEARAGEQAANRGDAST